MHGNTRLDFLFRQLWPNFGDGLIHHMPGSESDPSRPWRRLQIAVRQGRASLFADGRVIEVEHLGLLHAEPASQLTMQLPGAQPLRIDFSETGPKFEDIEYQIIKAALNHAGRNLSRASRWLGISRDAIRYRMERYERRDKA